MYSSIKQNLISNWNIARVIRLAISLIIVIESIQSHDITFGLLGTIFMFQALTNTGCCNVNGCNSNSANTSNDSEEIDYSEIKNK